ncbi:hypothetical protein NW756_003985 [Fusarium oxysporum]|nr:hypothetical protein NW756_003985 [Fusarium oxysporum]
MSKSACIYIGWLLITGILDAVRGMSDISYPYYEWSAVRELQWFLDTATNAELYQVVYPLAILGMFELCGHHMVRSPLLRCEDEDFSLVGRFIDPEISERLVRILGGTSDDSESFCGQEAENGSSNMVVGTLSLDDMADGFS